MTQPDGTTITIRQNGDEFFHYWENEDGQQVEKTADGWWRVKETPSEQSEISKRKQASRSYVKDAGTPRKSAGVINLAPRGLVILVNFSDVSYKSGNTQSAMSDLMNSANYTYNDATGSVREFFKAQSNGAYVPDFDVVGPYTLSHNRAYYGGNDSSGDDKLAGDMVVEACKAADADGVDFTQYNNDGDSEVDFVYVIYAGVGEADSDEDDAIWPHNWTIESARYYSNCTYTASQCKVDNLSINNYACSGELEGGGTYRCPIGTITHEFGHVLGLPDYYVTSKSATNYDKDYTPGSWHIMDYGSYNNDGRTPPNYSPHDKLYFGWSTPTLLAKDAQKDGTLTTTYGSAYQITGTTTSAGAKSTNRVWYLENRQKSGWDKCLPGHGLVVWEVQYDASNWTNNSPNNSSVGYTVVTANNLTRPYKPYVYNTTASSTSATPFPGTSNVRSYTPATGCALTEITESSGKITFKYNGGAPSTTWSYTLYGDHCAYPDDGTVLKKAAVELTIEPAAGYTLADAACWDVTMGGSALTCGTGFTYNSSTKKFRIASVTGDVEILVEGLRPVTWMTSGSTYATNVAAGGKITLPDDPDDCSATKKFVGWCTSSNYSNATTAPTFAKTGDTYSVATYYAVYATPNSGSAPRRAAAVNDVMWSENWTGVENNKTPTSPSASGSTVYGSATVTYSWTNGTTTTQTYTSGGPNSNENILVSKGNGALTASGIPTGGATELTVTYATSGKGSITVSTSTENVSVLGSTITVSNSGVTSFSLEFKNTSSGDNVRLDDIEVKVKTAGSGGSGGGSGSYKDYTTVCETCTLTGITLNTSSVTKTFVKDATFNYDNLVVTASYSDCGSKTVTPTSVSTPDMSSTGTKDVTVSYTEGSVTKTAQYQITVSAPYTVTYMVCGEEFTTQTYAPGATLVLPTETPVESTGKTFYGWIATEHYTGASAPAKISAGGAVNANATYYAVFH
jgi:M6 family metalloprotease-like protein